MSRPSLLLCAFLWLGAIAPNATAQGGTPATQPGSPQSQPQQPQQAQEARDRALALARQARTAEAKGEFEPAAKAFGKLVTLEPAKAEWVLGQARCLGRQRLFNDALDVLEGPGGQFRSLPEVATLRARTYLLKAEHEVAIGATSRGTGFLLRDAANIAEGVLKDHPDNRDALLVAAQARFQIGDSEGARKWASLAVKAHPDHPGGWVIRGQLEYQMFLVAVRAEQTPDNESRKATHLTTARESFQKAVELDPSRAFAHVRLGDLAAWSGSTEDSLSHYGDALAMDPGAKLDHDWIQNSFAPGKRLGLYGDAAERASRREGVNQIKLAALEWYAGRAALDAADNEAALRWFNSVLGRTPDDAGARYYAIRAAYSLGNSKQATKIALVGAREQVVGLADVVKGLDPTSRAQFISMVRTMAQQARSDMPACRDLNKLGAWITNDPAEWNNYAFLCRETGRYQESFEAYSKALIISPDDPQLLNDAAVILQYHLRSPENKDTAKRYYEKAIRLAREQLAAGNTSGEETGRIRTALRDATNNLARLR